MIKVLKKSLKGYICNVTNNLRGFCMWIVGSEFINNSFETKMFVITLLLILSSVVINPLNGSKEVEVTKAEVEKIANVFEGSGSVIKLDKAGKNSEVVDGSASQAVQDLEGINPLNSGTKSYKSSVYVQIKSPKKHIVANPQTSGVSEKVAGIAAKDEVIKSDQPGSLVELEKASVSNGFGIEGEKIVNTNIETGIKDKTDASSLSGFPSEHLENKSLLPKKKKHPGLGAKQIATIMAKAFGAIIATCGFAGVVGYSGGELIKHFSSPESGLGSGSKLYSGVSVLGSSHGKPLILSNIQSKYNSVKQPVKKEISSGPTEFTSPFASQSADSVIKHSRLNTKHTYLLKQKSIVYIIIAITLLLITAGIFAFKMQQIKLKQDLFTDMNQYYAHGSTMPSVCPNALLNQPNHLI